MGSTWWQEAGLTTAEGALYERFEDAPGSLTDRELVTLAGIKAALSEYSSIGRALQGMLMDRAGLVVLTRDMVGQFKAAVKQLLAVYSEVI